MLRSLLTIGQDGIETVIKSHFYEGGIPEMINQLHLAMIELYRGDATRIQHFCKVHSYAKLIAESEQVDEKCLLRLKLRL